MVRVGKSLLRGIEAYVVYLIIIEMICCLPGMCIQDMITNLPRPVKPVNFYQLLMIHLGTNDTTNKTPESVKIMEPWAKTRSLRA